MSRIPQPVTRSEYRENFNRKPMARSLLTSRAQYRSPHDQELLSAHAVAIPNANTHRQPSKTSVPLSSLMRLPATPDVSAIEPPSRAVPMVHRMHPSQYLARPRSASSAPRINPQQRSAVRGRSRALSQQPKTSEAIRHSSRRAQSGTRSRDAATGQRGALVMPARNEQHPQRVAHSRQQYIDPDNLLAIIDDLRRIVMQQQQQQQQHLLLRSSTHHPRHRAPSVRRRRGVASAQPCKPAHVSSVPAQQLRDSITQHLTSNSVAQPAHTSGPMGVATKGPSDVRTQQWQSSSECHRDGSVSPDLLSIEEDYWRHSQAVLDELDRKLQKL